MHVLKIGIAAGRKGAEQVQASPPTADRLELAARIRLARLFREIDVVDEMSPR